MSALANHKHELFAQGLAKGKSQEEAYRGAGYRGDRTAACRLATNVNVIARAAELKAKAAEKTVATVLDLAQQLDEDREFARKLKQSAAAVTATMGKAKLLGHLKDKVEHSGAIAVDHTVEAEREIAEIFGPTPHLIEPTHG
jgi:phage terminase small subunit